jgi:cobalamin synthase
MRRSSRKQGMPKKSKPSLIMVVVVAAVAVSQSQACLLCTRHEGGHRIGMHLASASGRWSWCLTAAVVTAAVTVSLAGPVTTAAATMAVIVMITSTTVVTVSQAKRAGVVATGPVPDASKHV